MEGKQIMDYFEESIDMHLRLKGKIEVGTKVKVDNKDDLSIAYMPGVAQPCIEIKDDPEMAYRLTIKANTVAVVSDGSAVPDLGNIGGLASLPVMEGKAVLFKEFGDVDAFPICLDTQDVDEIVETVKNIAPSFGGINLEDISAPRCYEIERRLQEELDIPVFHDDRHGTAVVVGAAVINAFRLINKPLRLVRAVISGTGAAGNAVLKMLRLLGISDILICDSKGIISMDRLSEFDENKMELLELSNKDGITGTLADAVIGRDLFIGVSAPDILDASMVKSMMDDCVILAMANPEPEIDPTIAKEAGARIVGTGRPDIPNQINNVLAFPGIFKGALNARAKKITDEMKLAATHALADLVSEDELKEDYVIPPVFKEGLADAVAASVARAWVIDNET